MRTSQHMRYATSLFMFPYAVTLRRITDLSYAPPPVPLCRCPPSPRLDGCFVTNAAVRFGCVLVTLDLQQGILGSGGAAGLSDELVAVAQAWLQETRLAAELPPGSTVALQVSALGLGAC